MVPGLARNHILQDAPSHAWIAPLDDDDIMLQRNLCYYADLIEQNPDKEWFINDFVRVDSELRYRGKEDYYHWKFESPKDMLDAIFRGECFAQGMSALARSYMIKLVGTIKSSQWQKI